MDQYFTVSPAEVGVVSGVIGAGIGYTIAPRKYNLEQLLTQKPDVFEKTLSKELINNSNKEQRYAHSILLEGRDILRKARQNNTMEAKLADLLGSPKYSKAYKNIKKLLPKARIQTAIVLGIIGGFMGSICKIIMGDNN